MGREQSHPKGRRSLCVAGLCLGTYGDARGVGVSYERGAPVTDVFYQRGTPVKPPPVRGRYKNDRTKYENTAREWTRKYAM